MNIEADQLGTLYRTPARIVAAETREELIQVLSYTMRALFPGLMRFDLCLADERGTLTYWSKAGSDRAGSAVDLPPSVDPLSLPDACVSARLVPALHGAKRGPIMSVPLLDGNAPVGMILAEAVAGKVFTSIDLQVLEGVAGVWSLAFQRLRSSRRTEQVRASFETDRRSATQVQRRLMRQDLPADIGVKVDAQYLPALEVGGDFYEVSYLGEGLVGAAIGDVSGKGVSAALIMSRVSSDVRRALRSGIGPSRVLQDVNTSLTDIETDTFVTASCLSIDARRHTLTVANAGHIPLMVRRASGEVFDFGPASGTPLGVMPCEYTEEHMALQAHDIVLLMTDGLVEALDCPSDRNGTRLLHRLVKSAPHDPKVINQRILEAANAAWSSQPRDDVTLLALQVGVD